MTKMKSDFSRFLNFASRIRWSRRTKRCGGSWRIKSRRYSFQRTKRVSSEFFKAIMPFWWSRPCWIISSRGTAISLKLAVCWTPRDTESLRPWVSRYTIFIFISKSHIDFYNTIVIVYLSSVTNILEKQFRYFVKSVWLINPKWFLARYFVNEFIHFNFQVAFLNIFFSIFNYN